MALDKVSAAMMNPQSVGESAPSNPTVGQRWYRASTAITYQYTNDGTSSFWLDVSSGGIGTSADRGVDFAGDTDPHLETNGTGLAIGSVYYNREKNKHFVCTTATTNSNVWSGRFAGLGGTETTVKIGSNFYRVHAFWDSGTFYMDDSINVDYLVIAGGGGGGNIASGGGGAGGVRLSTGQALTNTNYTITIGAGGAGQSSSHGKGAEGVASSISGSGLTTITATGGGGGAGGSGSGEGVVAGTGGSGGGGSSSATSTYRAGSAGINDGGTFGTATFQGYDGGDGTSNTAYYPGAGGGGAGGAGQDFQTATQKHPGDGGVGISTFWGMSQAETTTLLAAVSAGVVESSDNNYRYLAGGGAGATDGNATYKGIGGKGGGGNGEVATGTPLAPEKGATNTGSGGGGAAYVATTYGDGGSGIVIIRYAI